MRPHILLRSLSLSALLVVTLFSSGCLWLGSEMCAVRDTVMMSAAPDRGWDEKIEIKVGALVLGPVRGITAFTDAPPEARLALSSARAVEVGVYEIEGESSGLNRPAMLEAATRELTSKGWHRIIGVIDGNSTVGVFAAQITEGAERMRLCVVVLDGRELVIASALLKPEPLVALALEKGRRARSAPPAALVSATL